MGGGPIDLNKMNTSAEPRPPEQSALNLSELAEALEPAGATSPAAQAAAAPALLAASDSQSHSDFQVSRMSGAGTAPSSLPPTNPFSVQHSELGAPHAAAPAPLQQAATNVTGDAPAQDFGARVDPSQAVAPSGVFDMRASLTPAPAPALAPAPAAGPVDPARRTPVPLAAAAGPAAGRAPADPEADRFPVRWIRYGDRDVAIVMQNVNGPCPLLAVCNVLLLSGRLTLPGQQVSVRLATLIELIALAAMSCRSRYTTPEAIATFEHTLSEVIELLPTLAAGLDVNVKFTGPTAFEATRALVLFDLFQITLVHGWLPDPADPAARVLSRLSFNQAEILPLVTDHGYSATEVALVQQWLLDNSSQMTVHGLFELHRAVQPGQLAVLFYNNHFQVVTQHGGRLFGLATDEGFMGTPICWETLGVHGDIEHAAADFKAARIAPPRPPPEVDGDAALAAALQQEEQQRAQAYEQRQGQAQAQGQGQGQGERYYQDGPPSYYAEDHDGPGYQHHDDDYRASDEMEARRAAAYQEWVRQQQEYYQHQREAYQGHQHRPHAHAHPQHQQQYQQQHQQSAQDPRHPRPGQQQSQSTGNKPEKSSCIVS